MIEPRGPLSPQAPQAVHALPIDRDDWKLRANCATETGPILELEAEVCIECPVQRQCGELWQGTQDMLIRESSRNAGVPYLGGVWGGELRPTTGRRDGEYGSFTIEPCGEDCEAPIHARGACKIHYERQYKLHIRDRQRARRLEYEQ